jgi:hypothetical protein
MALAGMRRDWNTPILFCSICRPACHLGSRMDILLVGRGATRPPREWML